jgi:hypothetical protein
MTTRLYFTDALMAEFDATVTACHRAGDAFAVAPRSIPRPVASRSIRGRWGTPGLPT